MLVKRDRSRFSSSQIILINFLETKKETKKGTQLICVPCEGREDFFWVAPLSVAYARDAVALRIV
jgi:hypothetical protein